MSSMKQQTDQERFGNLTFSDFQKMASDPSLTCYEKIGFPTAYRQGKEELILQDILAKLTHLQEKNKKVFDIGAGCSQLPELLADLCGRHHHQLIIADSQEMLDQLPDRPFITKIPGFYPNQFKNFIAEHKGSIDVVLSYSVVQYVFAEANLFEFVDDTLSLLAEGGQLLLGDVPNSSKRKRFLHSNQGIQYHQTHFGAHSLPDVKPLQLDAKQMDDGVVLGLLMRCRNAGFDAYVLPQAKNLPMANRREDLLIIRP
jgi:hypothetical protein